MCEFTSRQMNGAIKRKEERKWLHKRVGSVHYETQQVSWVHLFHDTGVVWCRNSVLSPRLTFLWNSYLLAREPGLAARA